MIFWGETDDATSRRKGWALDPSGFIEAFPGWDTDKGHIWLQVWDEALGGDENALRALWVLAEAHADYFINVAAYAWEHKRRCSPVYVAIDQLVHD